MDSITLAIERSTDAVLRALEREEPTSAAVPTSLPTTLPATLPATQLEADLRQLGGLARPGLAGDDDDLVVPDRRRDVGAPPTDRQLGRERDVHNVGDSPAPPVGYRNVISRPGD